MDFISINDEIQDLKKQLKDLGKEVVKVEKLGNGNMSAFQLKYRDAPNEPIKTSYFWRHDIENFLARFSKL